MKIKVTHPLHEYGLDAGFIYDLPENIAREIIEVEKGFALDEAPQVEKKPRRVKKEVEHDNG